MLARIRLFAKGASILSAVGAMFAYHPLFGQIDDGKLPRATVHVAVFGPFGGKIEEVEVHLLTPDRKRDLTFPRPDLTRSDVPYGEYIVAAWDRGGGMAERGISVNYKEVWVRIGLAFPTGDRAWPAGDLTISGELKPVPRDMKDWWVRVEGMFLHVSRESPVLTSGKFSVGGLQMGTYLVELFDGSKLRHLETVEIDSKEPNRRLTISLPPQSRK